MHCRCNVVTSCWCSVLKPAFVWQAAEAYLVDFFEVSSSKLQQRVARLTF